MQLVTGLPRALGALAGLLAYWSVAALTIALMAAERAWHGGRAMWQRRRPRPGPE